MPVGGATTTRVALSKKLQLEPAFYRVRFSIGGAATISDLVDVAGAVWEFEVQSMDEMKTIKTEQIFDHRTL